MSNSVKSIPHETYRPKHRRMRAAPPAVPYFVCRSQEAHAPHRLTCSIRSVRRSSFDAVLGGYLYRCSPKNPTRLELTKPRHGPCLIENWSHPLEECA